MMNSSLEVLMISSPNRDDLVFPKGEWENDCLSSNMPQTLEEACVRGNIMGYFRRNVTVVTMYSSLGEAALCHSLNESYYGAVGGAQSQHFTPYYPAGTGPGFVQSFYPYYPQYAQTGQAQAQAGLGLHYPYTPYLPQHYATAGAGILSLPAAIATNNADAIAVATIIPSSSHQPGATPDHNQSA